MKIYSVGYALLRAVIKIPYRLFYRKIRIIGLENIPEDKPIILAPNHQNALMDPLIMIFSVPRQIVFLARGDVFKEGFITKFLTFIKIMPVYRQHDGMASLKKNDLIFDRSVDYLSDNGVFCLFPEAIHNPHRNLRPLKKGIPRIAFMAMKKSDFQLDIQIIPTGIYYENKNSSDSYLQVKYGEPISVKDYIEQIKENEQKAMSQLSLDMTPPMKSLIIDIEENQDYELVEDIRALYSDRLLKRFSLEINDENRFRVDQSLVLYIKGVEFSESLKFDIDELSHQMQENKWTFRTIIEVLTTSVMLLKSIAFVLFLPIAIQGFILNIVPLAISKYLRTKVIKDPQFISSINFITGAFISPIYFILLSLISLLFVDYYYALLVLVLSPITAYLSYYYFKKLSILKEQISFKFSQHRNKIDALKNKISEQLDVVFEDFELR